MVASRKVLDAYVELSAKGTGQVNQAMRSVETSAMKAYSAMARIGEVAVGNVLASGFSSLVSAVSQVPAAMINANASYEQAAVGLEVLLGSAEAAKQRISDLNTFAASTPFELPGILQASKQLEMANIPAEEHQKVLKMTGDMASAAGVDISELGMWVSRAYANIQAGKPFGEAAQRMAELGVLSVDARAKLEEMSDSGASGAEVWGEFSKSMERFGGMMEKQSQTFGGLMSTMSDGITQGLRVFGEPLFNMVKDGLEQATGLVSSAGWADAMASAGEGVANALADVAAWYAPVLDGAQRVGESFLAWFDGIDVLGGLQSAFQGVADVSMAWADLMLSSYQAIIEMVGGLASLISDGLTAAMEAVGITAGQVGDGISSVFDWIIEQTHRVAAAIRNWDLSFQYVWIYAQNFGANLVEMLGAFLANAQIVFANFPQFASAAFGAVMQLMENLGTNIANLASSISEYLGELLSGNLTADFSVDLTPIMSNVKEQFAGLPVLVEAQTKDARERFSKELDALDREWDGREQKREKRIAQRADSSRKAIAEASGINKEDVPAAEGTKKAVAKKEEMAGKKDKAVAITDVAAFWEKLQGASAKQGEKKAEQQREKHLAKADKANQLLTDILGKLPGGAIFS